MQQKFGKRSGSALGSREATIDPPLISTNSPHKVIVDYIISHAEKDQRPYLNVDVLGVQLLGLLDSGATHCILGNSGWGVLQNLGFKLEKSSPSRVGMANGDSCNCLGSLQVPVRLMEKCKLVNMLVVPDIPHSLILGIDFWDTFGVVPNLREDVWSFSSSSGEIAAIEVSENLSCDQRRDLEALIKQNFRGDRATLGCTSLVEHVIETESPPIKQRYYPVSPHVQRHINKELDDMLAAGIVEKSTSAWSSPVLLIPKKDGSFRFCVDFRKLNAVTKRDAYPLPYISAILDRLGNAKYLSSLDIKSAYWQVPVAEKSRDFLSFTIPGRGLFRFNRLPFGLHNAPATWQRLIDRVLGPELEPYVFVYLDDIIVVSSTFEKHLEVLSEVFKRLREANLTVSVEKCNFCRDELKYLGYVVTRRGIHVDRDKIKPILELSTPKNVKEVRSLIGMASWYRKFIPEFSTLLAPMSALLRKNIRFVWSSPCQEALDKLKEALVSAPVLRCPDFNLPFVLQTDASGYGIGAVLSQVGKDGEQVVCYLSRSLMPNERKFSTTERECLAVIWAIEKLRPYLEGSVFTVITDHHSLVWLNNLKDPQGRLARWAVRLQQFDFSIIHRKGKEHLVPDYLSRDVPSIALVETEVVSDKWYLDMVRRISENPLNYPKWRVEGQKIFKHVNSRCVGLGDSGDEWKLVVPKERRGKLLQEYHDLPTAGHMGIFKTFNRLAERFYWPKMRCDVARYVRTCETCQAVKVEPKKPAGLMLSNPKVSRPWQVISADLVGPFPKSKSGNMFVLAVSDYFSKFSLFFPLRRATSFAVTRKLVDEVFLLYGAPSLLLTDNGKQFVSREFKSACKEFGVKNRYNAAYHPQANPVERVNRVLKTMLKSYVGDDQRDWDQQLPKIGCAVRTARHEVTGFTPYFLNFGRHQVLNGNDFGTVVDTGTLEFDRSLAVSRSEVFPELFQQVRRRMKVAYERNRAQYNLRKRDVEYQEGDMVWRRNTILSDAGRYFSAKLAKRFVGPYRVKKKLSIWTYELVDNLGKSKGIWHAKDLKPYLENVDA